MLTLIFKDFKLLFQGSSSNKMGKFLSLLFTIVVGVLFIVIEVYLFQAIFSKMEKVKNASHAYFSLFLFIVSTLLTVFAVFTAMKLFFNSEDNIKLQSMPVSNTKIVLSKMIFMFITMYSINLVFNLPLFITYGIIYRKLFSFYFTAVFYPVLLFFFQAGVALLLVYPVKVVLDFFKKHIIIQFIAVFIIAFGLTYLYSLALNLFISLVTNNNINRLFTTDVINKVTTAAKFMVPINFLEDAFVNNRTTAIFPALAISIGMFAIGVSVAIYFYNRFLQNMFQDSSAKKKQKQLKIVSPKKALIKKELVLLFRNSNFIFSFTGLLIVEPFLSYLIIRSMNAIFTSGSLSYYLASVPNIVAFMDVMLMMLISSIIFQGANSYITNENKNVRLMKSIPVSLFTQLAIKVFIPLILSLAFLTMSYVILLITNVMKVVPVLYGALINIIFIVTLSIVSLFEELHIRRNQTKNTLLSTLYTYLVPTIYFLFALLLCYYQVNYNITFLIGLGVVVLSLIPYLIKFRSRVNDKFLSLEVSN